MAQFVFLVHHADAVPGGEDARRPLSPLGLRQAESVATQARTQGAAPRAIWHSGKLRARQTADAWRRIVAPAAEFADVHGLAPEDDPDGIVVLIDADTRDVAVVSHMPFLPMLLHRLTTGRPDRMSARFPLNGCVALERDENRWIERWRLTP